MHGLVSVLRTAVRGMRRGHGCGRCQHGMYLREDSSPAEGRGDMELAAGCGVLVAEHRRGDGRWEGETDGAIA